MLPPWRHKRNIISFVGGGSYMFVPSTFAESGLPLALAACLALGLRLRFLFPEGAFWLASLTHTILHFKNSRFLHSNAYCTQPTAVKVDALDLP